MRKTVIFSSVLLLLVSGFLYSETVFLYIENSLTDEELFSSSLSEAYALEDGVMNEFFNEGHIIFNAGIKGTRSVSDPPFEADRPAVRMAKSGGARYLLEVMIDFLVSDESGVPEMSVVEFAFSDVNSRGGADTGQLKIREIIGSDMTNPEKKGFKVGQIIAQQALSMW